MTHVVRSAHVESLESGRTVVNGEEISDTEAKRNQKLIDRGVLVKRAEKKPAAKPSEKEGSSA